MYSNKIFAISGALLSLVAAMPMNHVRDMIVVTKTHETIVTIPVTRTVWLAPGETAPTTAVHHSAPAAPMKPVVTTPSVELSSSDPTPTSASTSAAAPPALSISEAAVQPTTSATVASTSAAVTSAVQSTAAVPETPPPAPSAPSTGTSGSIDNAHADAITDGPAAAGRAYVGDLTWYSTGLGACGFSSSPSDKIVAVSEDIWDYYGGANPNDNPICKQWVEITGVDGTVYPAQIVDRCTGCSSGSLDLSEDFFNIVTNNGNGRVHDIHWQFAGST